MKKPEARSQKPEDAAAVLRRVAAYYGVPVAAVRCGRRTEPEATIRGVAIYLAHLLEISREDISAVLGSNRALIPLRVVSLQTRVTLEPVLQADVQRLVAGAPPEGTTFATDLAARRRAAIRKRAPRHNLKRLKLTVCRREPATEPILPETSEGKPPGFGSLEILERRLAAA